MKQIILIRHAKVDIDHGEKIDSASLKNWVASYDTANIVADSLPIQETINIAKNTDVLVTSSLRRAVDSAKVLGVDIYERNALFSEALIPEVSIPFLKLKPRSWLVVLRVLLLFGLGKKDATLKASKLQAKKAMERLLELSDEYESVVLVGHGGMNWLIRKALMKEGWELDGKGSHENWGTTVLKMKEE